MSKEQRPGGVVEIASGAVAAGGFLAMVFALQMPLGLSAALAAGLYLGARLATPARSPRAEESATEEELLDAIDRLAGSVTSAPVRSRFTQIAEQARRVLEFLDRHPEKGEAWRAVLRECLQSTQRIVQRYLELARFFDDPNHPSLQEMEALLDQVATTFANLRRRLVDEGAADLSGEMGVLRSTLQALDEMNG